MGDAKIEEEDAIVIEERANRGTNTEGNSFAKSKSTITEPAATLVNSAKNPNTPIQKETSSRGGRSLLDKLKETKRKCDGKPKTNQ